MKIDFFKKSTFLVVSTFLSVCGVLASPPDNLTDWEMVFDDEFEGSSLDKTKWNPTYNWGHTHNHRAYCVEENVSVSNGCLVLKGEAKRHPQAPSTCSSGGKTYSLDYTSGAIDTRGHFDVKQGYIEGRFKMPSQLGTWSAFWMLQDGWPPEIDIFEVPHARTDHHYYLHYTNTTWYAEHGDAWDHEASFGGVHKGPDKSADFHTYGLGWTETTMSFYFDDNLVASYSRPSEISQTKAMYIIINLAIGGWATDNGNPIEVTSGNPAYLQCDWVRVWKRKSLSMKLDSVRLLSVDANLCMQASGNDIILGDCDSPASIASFTDMGGIYRINFGDKVLEIPNESKESGASVGLWEWNGKPHQQIGVRQMPDDSTVVTLQFIHSSLYVQNSSEGDVIQNGYSKTGDNCYWQILPKKSEGTNLKQPLADPFYVVYDKNGILKLYKSQISAEMSPLRLYTSAGLLLLEHSLPKGNYAEMPVSLTNGIYIVQIGYKTYKLKVN